jgi:multiple sugar transport system ATP-binding protein
MASLSLRSIRKSFGKVEVIHGIDLDVADGEFVALVGPSGCGKSTLLRLIAGLDEVSAGDIVIGGDVVNDLSPRDRNIAMVFQSYALYPHMSVEQNMGFNLKLAGLPRDEIRPRVLEAARMLNLEDLLARRPAQLSGGQRQRVAMGRAIVRDPAVFLFDEPLSNLDAKLRVQMRAEIKLLHARLKTTTVYVTHDQIEAMTMADRIVVLRDGLVEQIGTPLELYDRPANAFVAGFIGSPSMNLLTATLAGAAVTVTNTATALPVAGAGSPDHRPVLLGIRPEDCRLASAGDGLPARVSVVEPTGAELHIVAEASGQPIIVALRDRHAIVPGDLIHIRADPARLHVFDPGTGLRLAS